MPHTKALAVRYEDTGLPSTKRWNTKRPSIRRDRRRYACRIRKPLLSVTKTQAFPTKRWNTKRPSIRKDGRRYACRIRKPLLPLRRHRPSLRRDGIRSALPYEKMEYEAPFHTKRLNTKRLMIITKPQGLPYEELEYEELNIHRTRGFSNTRVVTTKPHRNELVTSRIIL